MPAPATTGVLRSNIVDMQIGDYIVWRIDDTGTHIMDGTLGITEVPLTGMANSASLNGYYWYGVKVAKGLIISDRVRSHTLTWDSMNASKNIEGLSMTISGVSGTVRSLKGGVAYVDAKGNLSLKDYGYGAYPKHNEWDKYIKGFSRVQDMKTLDDVWHFDSMATWCQETGVLGTWTNISGVTAPALNTSRIMRGYYNRTDSNWKDIWCPGSTTSVSYAGFRPVFEYKE